MGPKKVLRDLVRHTAWKTEGMCRLENVLRNLRWAGVLGKSACKVAREVVGWARLGLVLGKSGVLARRATFVSSILTLPPVLPSPTEACAL